MRHLLLLTILLPAAAIANPPMADYQAPSPMHGKPPMPHFSEGCEHLPPFLHGLDLTAQQQTAIKNLLKNQHGAMAATWDNEEAAKRELHRLSFSSDYSEDKALALIEKSLAVHKTIELQRAQLDNSIFKLLTAEQQEKLKNAEPPKP